MAAEGAEVGVATVGLDGLGEVCLEVPEESADMNLALLREGFVGEVAVGVDGAEVNVTVASLAIVEVNGIILGKVVEVEASIWVIEASW